MACVVVWTTTTLLIICPSSPIHVNSECSTDCGCSEAGYAPVCDRLNQVTYASPCHAGCRAFNFTTTPVCTCISGEYDITDGMCEQHCPRWRYWTFSVITFFCTGAGLFFVPLVPAAMMRSTTARLKGLQQALQIVLLRLVGALPGTIIAGWLIDGACTLWTKDADGSNNSCFAYDNFKFAVNLVVPGSYITPL